MSAAAPLLAAHAACALAWTGLVARQWHGLREGEAGLRRVQRQGWAAGLCMGGLIAAGLGARYALHGGFHWPLDHPLGLARSILFLPLWISSFHLEIWTMEPARRAWARGEAAPAPLARRVRRRLGVHLLGACAVGALCLAGRPG